ncbi:hypothetical protein [Streptomyces daliensis]
MPSNEEPRDEATPEDPQAPRPEPLRFYGTTWVDHSGGYALRRAAFALGALLAAVVGALVLRFAYEGLAIAEVGGWVSIMIVVAFAVCSSLAFSRTLGAYSRRADESRPAAPDSSLRSVKAIGFIGVLLAYALRTFVEAPGERLRRAEYEEALARHERLRAARTGNPSARKRNKPKRKR